jgi:hypothetical protein
MIEQRLPEGYQTRERSLEPGTRPIIYLASPYSHPDPAVRLARYEAVTKYAAELTREGHVIFGPITMSHPISPNGEGDPPAPFDWLDWDEPFMRAASSCIVLMLDGWEKSTGVQHEVRYFRANGKTVTYMTPPEHLQVAA